MENPFSFPDLNIPPEILSEICSYVPLKSLGRLQCLSKDYLNLLRSYAFTKTHLARTADSPPNLLLLGSRSIFRVTGRDANKLYGVLMKFNSHLCRIGGSCDGLVLVVGEFYSKLLINPITKKMLELPESPDSLDPTWCCCLHGFGHDQATDDYKVVTVSFFCPNRPEEYADDVAFIDIYSVKSNSWRRIGVSPYTHVESWSANSSGVLLKGALHWLVSDSDSTFISAFSLASENFEVEILGPDSLDSNTLKSCKMMVINGCIGIIDDLSDDSKVNMFILKIYGSAESWTKVVVDLGNSSWDKAVCVWNDWLFLSVDTDRDTDHDLVGYSFDDGVWGYQNIDVDCCDDKSEQFYDGVMFSESILSPHVFSAS